MGQLVYKKEKKLEEIDRHIRTTHIQLEFCIEARDGNVGIWCFPERNEIEPSIRGPWLCRELYSSPLK